MLWLLLSLIVPFATGFVLVTFVWPRGRGARRHGLIRACLASGLGLGISSGGFFVATVMLGRAGPAAVVAADGLVLVGALVVFGLRSAASGTSRRHDGHPASPGEGGAPHRLLRAVAGIATVSALTTFLLVSWIRPHGDWDAWAIWNLRARFLFRGGEHWRDGLSALVGWSHPDYPLLLPGLVARSWVYVGHETVIVPVALAMLFAAATVGLVFAAVAALRGEAQGLLAALMLVSTPGFIAQGTTQHADVPLGFFVLAALVLCAVSDRMAVGNRGLLSVAGAVLGLAAWTKNEGLLFVAAMLVARLAAVVPRNGWRAYGREVLALAGGLAPILLVVLYFKTQLAPPSELLPVREFETVRHRLGDTGRYGLIASGLATEIGGFGDWAVSVVGLLTLYWLCVGTRIAAEDRTSLSTGAITLGLMLVGYCGVFLVTPYDLPWHLKTSLPRLLVQLWPSCLLVYWWIMNMPGEAAADREGSQPDAESLRKPVLGGLPGPALDP